MIELPLVFTSGLLGSSHCLGMCGPFAALIGGGATSWHGNLRRQTVYSAGRIFTYSFLGAVAGFSGARLQSWSTPAINVSAVLALVAGCFLLYEGCQATGWLPVRWQRSSTGGCLGGVALKTLLHSPTAVGVFLAGLATGFLPCGLVYAFLALAVQTGEPHLGAVTMAVFGCGTVPLMVATGCSVSLMSLSLRRRLFALAAWCVMLAGCVSIARGVGFLWPGDAASATSCPFCNS